MWTVTHGILELKQAIPLGISEAKITPSRFLYVLSALGNVLGYESHDLDYHCESICLEALN